MIIQGVFNMKVSSVGRELNSGLLGSRSKQLSTWRNKVCSNHPQQLSKEAAAQCRCSSPDAETQTSKEPELWKPEFYVDKALEGSIAPQTLVADGDAVPKARMPYQAIFILAGLGAVETLYLTGMKYLQQPVSCPITFTCESVLNSKYAFFGPIPLSAIGASVYISSGLLARVAYGARKAGLFGNERLFCNAYYVTSACQAIASTWLLYVMYFRLGDLCSWCIGSASISYGMAALGVWGMNDVKRKTWGAAVAASVAAAALGLGVYHVTQGYQIKEGKNTIDIPYRQKDITSESTAEAIQLARELKSYGAKFYGAFWCTHCFDQKMMFGKEAAEQLPYIECYPNGYSSANPSLAQECADAKLGGFPTWDFNGEKVKGDQEPRVLRSILDQKLGKTSGEVVVPKQSGGSFSKVR